jgi:hypothetical protein
MAKTKHSFILCFDFDGTLVLPEADPIFHPGLGLMIKQLRAMGAAWVVNTGRSLGQTLQGLHQYGLFMEPDYLIVRECDVYRPGLFSRWTDFGSWNKQARKAHDRFVRDHAGFFDAARRFVEDSGQAQFIAGDDGDLGIVAFPMPASAKAPLSGSSAASSNCEPNTSSPRAITSTIFPCSTPPTRARSHAQAMPSIPSNPTSWAMVALSPNAPPARA